MKKLLFIGCTLAGSLLLPATVATAQGSKASSTQLQTDMNLAQNYLQSGDFEKAALLYEKLYSNNEKNTYYYRQYYNSLMGMRSFAEAEKLVKKQQKIAKKDVTLYIDLGRVYKETDRNDDAAAQFELAVKEGTASDIAQLGSLFGGANLNEYAAAAYLRGAQLDKNKPYYYELALTYQRMGDIPKMIAAYLDYAANTPEQMPLVLNNLQRTANSEKGLEELQAQLYTRIQQQQDRIEYIELLTWVLKQQKDFEGALVQMKALDRRLNEDGSRVLDLASQALQEQQYSVAVDAYQYVIDKGANSNLYTEARVQMLHTLNQKLAVTNTYTPQEVEKLRDGYLETLAALGKNASTADAMLELARLYAYQLNDLNSATNLAQEVVDMTNADQRTKGYAKLELGDYYLMSDNVWEATLLYSQVDKAFKDDILGEEARFRNAKLTYFNGDFDWAQSQLDVLKASTSELISNDAIELSTFIIDNMGLDTTANTMNMFARAELLMTQNRTADALATFDSINTLYPKHVLSDDIIMMRAKIALKKRNYPQTIDYLQSIVTDYKDDILVDNALFMLGDLYQNQLNEPQKAMEYYQNILLNQTGSLFMAEARKRYRKLRGDKLNN